MIIPLPCPSTPMADHRALLNAQLCDDRIAVLGPVTPEFASILTPDACRFLARCHRRFEAVRQDLLARRKTRDHQLATGQFPMFLPETRAIRESDYRVAPIPLDLQDRRVEITGPVDRKMVINALNSGAACFMADFEDATAPTWSNLVSGQVNCKDAVWGSISWTSPDGRVYKLNPKCAVLLVRPRGWHLPEKHFLVDGTPIAGSLFDFGLYFYHNAHKLLSNKSPVARGPYFYLPKLESHVEARLWNDVFNFAQDAHGIPRGSIRATVLIETILAAFEMDEILYELRDHSAGLNCGRWDYIFSFIKKFRDHPAFVCPDRSQITMTVPFMQAYVDLLIKTCHRRGIHAMGGMAAQIPIRNDARANEAAMAKVKADKLREARAGHDGTWVAHPGLIPIAKGVFDTIMPTPNQIAQVPRNEVFVRPEDIIAVPKGTITENGLRGNLSVCTQYVQAWLNSVGCVPLNSLMEDAATAEICRVQVWQWLRHGAHLDDGRPITRMLVDQLMKEEQEKLRRTLGDGPYEKGRFPLASSIVLDMMTKAQLDEFLTLPIYEHILTVEGPGARL